MTLRRWISTGIGIAVLAALAGVQALWAADPAKPAASASQSKASAAAAESLATFRSPTAGFSIVKPAGWVFATVEQIQANRERVRLRDRELEEQMRQHAQAPLVAMTRHPEPHDDLNPSVQVILRPLGTLEGKSATELLGMMIPPIRNAVADFEYVDSIQPARVGGRDAAYMKAAYTVVNSEGDGFPTLSRMWVVPRGKLLFLIGMSGPRQGPEVSEEEFAAALRSIHIDD